MNGVAPAGGSSPRVRASRARRWCAVAGGAVVLLLAARLVSGNDVPQPPPVRLGSGPLMRSVQNEVDAAIARAQNWLVARQAPDGSWGGGSPYLTAVCALALHAEQGLGPRGGTAAHDRASRWLQDTPQRTVTTTSNVLDIVWTAIVQRVVDPDAAVVPPLPDWHAANGPDPLVLLAWREARLLQPASGTNPPLPSLPSATNVALRLIQASQEPAPPPDMQARVAAAGRAWSTADLLAWRETEAQRAWWLARAINRLAHGSLMLTPRQPIDWRRDLADCWVNRQRIAPQGGGYWPAGGEPSVEETAFAILLLHEL